MTRQHARVACAGAPPFLACSACLLLDVEELPWLGALDGILGTCAGYRGLAGRQPSGATSSCCGQVESSSSGPEQHHGCFVPGGLLGSSIQGSACCSRRSHRPAAARRRKAASARRDHKSPFPDASPRLGHRHLVARRFGNCRMTGPFIAGTIPFGPPASNLPKGCLATSPLENPRSQGVRFEAASASSCHPRLEARETAS